MQALADNGAYVLAEEGSRLLFLRRRILPSWLAFVPGVLAVVALGNGIVQLVAGSAAAGGVLVLLGLLSALGLLGVVRSRGRARQQPLDPSAALVVVDLAERTLCDAAGRVLAPLDAVRIGRSMQLTSSARALEVRWPGGSVVVCRGDALALWGSIGGTVDALRSRGIPVSG